MPDEKTKYPLLGFEYDKRPYEELLKLEPHPWFIDTITPNSADYLHSDFGLYSGDAELALAHAVHVLKELEKEAVTTPPSGLYRIYQKILIDDLCADFSHYCTCVKMCHGSKADLCGLMEAVLAYGGDKVVYDEVMEWNKLVNADSPVSLDSVFNFDELYIKTGDHFLFLKNDISSALRFYSLADLTWNTNNFCIPERGKNYSVDFHNQYKLLIYRVNGEPYSTNLSPSAQLLRSPASSFSNLPELLSSVVIHTQSILKEAPSRCDSAKRSALLTFILIVQKYLVFEIAELESSEDSSAWKKAVLEASLLLKNTSFDALASAAQKLQTNEWGAEEPLSYEAYLKLVKAAHLSALLLDKLSAEETSEPIAYYTSSDVFSYMLPEKCTGEKKDRLGRLTVMHLSYMNDPNEGKTLRKALEGPQYGVEKKGRKELNVPYVFVKCFSPRIDYLPMWEMYGDHARGCCLSINWKCSKPSGNGIEPILYRVCYLQKKDDLYRAQPDDNPSFSKESEKVKEVCAFINKQLDELSRIANALPKPALHYFDDILSKVRYLFKDSSYSYEQELRVIYQTKENILHTDGDKPWLFVQTPFPLQLAEVILGPKFPDVSTRVPYLQEQIDQMCKKTDTASPRITLSEIDYR